MKKIRVLHYGLSDNCGGIENVVFSWFKHKPDNVIFDFVNDDKTPLAYQDEFIKGGSTIHYMEKRFEHPVKRYFSFKRILEENDYDYFHYHVMNNDEIGLIIACNNSKKTRPIIHCHSMYKGSIPFKEKILRAEFGLLGIGQDYLRLSCAELAGKNMFGEKGFTVIDNGVDYDKYHFDEAARKNLRREYGFKESDIVIGHIGHVCPEKNYPFLFEAFAKLKKKRPDFKLLLIGNVDNSDSIRRLLSRYDVGNETVFTGVVTDTSKLFSAMDLYFFPSIAEGFGITAVEAQINGLPCVLSKCITKEVVISDRVVFIDFDADYACKEIISLADAKMKRNDLSLGDNLNIAKTTAKLMEFYFNNEQEQ